MSGLRRFLVGTLVLIVALATVAGVSAWWYRTTRPIYRLRQGQEALRKGRPDKADRLAQRLEDDGHSDYAHLLRGEAFLRDHELELATGQFRKIEDQGDLRLSDSRRWRARAHDRGE